MLPVQNTDNTYITIEDYLRGCVGITLPDDVINTILLDRGIAQGTEAELLDKKQRDLCKADLYMWCATVPTTFGLVEDANGVWKHKEGAIQVQSAERRIWKEKANAIYAEYGEKKHTSKIRIISFGTSMVKHC